MFFFSCCCSHFQVFFNFVIDILQPDVNWVGGLTEARRVVALASAFNVPVIPHGSSVFSYHLQMAFPSCPMAEFLVCITELGGVVLS